jgi:hypothetical protein
MRDPDQPYLDRGFPNRKSYLESLSKRYGFTESFVKDLAQYFKTPASIDVLDKTMKVLGDDKYADNLKTI